MTEPHLPVAVTLGDPAGIGPDIIVTAAARLSAAERAALVVIGCAGTLRTCAASLGLGLPIAPVPAPGCAVDAGALAVLDMPVAVPSAPGRPDARNAGAIISWIERAVALVAAGEAAAVVTAPIAKAVLTSAGFPHPGHTEFLAELAGRHWPGERAQPVMLLAAEALRVIPVTIHIPLARVPAALTRGLLEETVRIAARDLVARFGIAHPRIAVAGLNPHAGESGTLGREEIETIAPAIARLRAEGLDVTGPHSADTLFHAAARARYDVAITMYHDQGLIPIKTLAFDSGVNVTLGLPFVRTSPDHGTAFDIAGSGRADPASLLAALALARQLSSRAGAP